MCGDLDLIKKDVLISSKDRLYLDRLVDLDFFCF